MDDEHFSDSSYSSSHRSRDSSYEGSEGVEWLEHVASDGSLLYAESYVSSTVREKQVQALKASAAAASAIEKKSSYVPPKEIHKKNKLLRLLKRRPSVRVSRGSGVGAGVEGPKGATDPSPKVTFRDNPSGEVRHVTLQVAGLGNNLGRRASLCETVLGVVPGRFSEPPDSRVMVAGIVPGSQALKNGQIKIGDCLKEVNSESVTWDNLDHVLASLQVPSTLTLAVQKCASETLPEENDHDLKRVTQTQLVKVITGSDGGVTELRAKLQEIPHTVLYLSLVGVTEDSPDGADIRYQFPNWSNQLVKVRGMFITTAHTVQEAVGAPALCSSVSLDGEYYHIAYLRENNDIFLIALPHAYISSHEIIKLMDQVAILLKFEFGTLANGVGNPEHKVYVDHLLSLVLGGILSRPLVASPMIQTTAEDDTQGISAAVNNPYLPQLPTYSGCRSHAIASHPTWLTLNNDLDAKIQMDNCLSELESGDFGDEDSDCEDCQGLYNIVGCCLFYKGHLCCSHLPVSWLQSVHLYARDHGLLALTAAESLSQLVVWREVFPDVDREQFPEAGSRHYLLIVAMNHLLLGAVLESCSNLADLDPDHTPGPDPFLVDQAEATLYQLHSLRVNNVCEESLSSSNIEVITPDHKYNRSTPIKKTKDKNADVEGVANSGIRHPDVPSILKQKSSPLSDTNHSGAYLMHDHHHHHHQHIVGCAECERGGPRGGISGVGYGVGGGSSPGGGDTSDDSYHSSSHNSSLLDNDDDDEEDGSDSDWRIYKPSDGRGLHAFAAETNDHAHKLPHSPIRVTNGCEEVLFHLVHLDIGAGVVIEPQETSSPSPLTEEVMHTFSSTANHIHHILHAQHRGKESVGHYGCNRALNNVREHGVLFTYSPPSSSGDIANQLAHGKKKAHSFSYWVVGRIFSAPYPRELYVCYEASVPQNLLEIAYKLS